ncbi:Crp/Fnr family transcriptional regulator [Clostridiaceae bacterium M8S5]|nr:Crp/Fnr family transcriptional regulator [Clostridiaceae bacterium M8S5]
MNDISLILANCSLFKNISYEKINELLSKINYRIVRYKEDEIIFSPFQIADKMGVILSGSVDIQKLFPDGKIIILDRKVRFDLIAEPSIFSTHQYYPSTACVNKSCEILFLNKANLQKLFTLNNTFMLNYIQSISNLTLDLKHKIGILSLNSIKEKIAGYLIHDFKVNNSKTITLPFSKKAWSEYMDVSRTSLSRELKKLQTEGIISFNRRKINILDLKRLEKILSL